MMRRLLRFRLRTFFVVIAIFGVLVYPILSEWQIMQREQAALRDLLPSKVDYAPAESPIARWIGSQHPRAGRRVTRVVLERNWASNNPKPKDLKRLRDFRQLRAVEFTNPVSLEPTEPGQVLHSGVRTLVVRHQGNRDDMKWLSAFPGVRSLAIRSSELSPTAVKSIAESRVRSLELGLERSAHDLAPLTQLTSLRSLRLSGTATREAPMLWRSLPDLVELSVDRHSPWTAEKPFAPMQATALRTLRISNCRLDPQEAERIARQTKLQTLQLHGVSMSIDSLRPLRKLPQLHTLRFTPHYLDADAWAELGKFQTLQRLELTQSVGPRQMAELNSLTQLQVLELDAQLSDEAVVVLADLPVRRVVVHGRDLSKKSRQRLEAARSADRLTIRDDL